jgi:TrmH family RNA methyltransferase
MLSVAGRARLTVVLVGARNPQNIGASARAMQDFGFSDLRIVNEFGAPFEAAQLEAKSAVAAGEVMRSARRFASLAEAIADCTLVVATTAIGERTLAQPVRPLQETAPEMADALAADDARVALLFGSEKTGLTSDQLSHANVLTTVPLFQPVDDDGVRARHLSMNLGQAVAVCLYELTREGIEGARPLPVLHEAGATAEDRERLGQLLLDVFESIGYARRFPANAAEPVVRQLAMQLGVSHREAMMWMGVLKQVLWREGKNEDAGRATPRNSST